MTQAEVLELEAHTESTERNFSAAVTEGNVCTAFESVKPILDKVANLWFFGAKTRTRIKQFIAVFDAYCQLVATKG